MRVCKGTACCALCGHELPARRAKQTAPLQNLDEILLSLGYFDWASGLFQREALFIAEFALIVKFKLIRG